jgi:hypothetical protein
MFNKTLGGSISLQSISVLQNYMLHPSTFLYDLLDTITLNNLSFHSSICEDFCLLGYNTPYSLLKANILEEHVVSIFRVKE